MSNTKLAKLMDVLSYIFILLSIIAVPLIFDKNLANFFVLPKQYVLIGLVLFNILFFAIKVVLLRTVYYRQSVLDIPLLIFLLVLLLSSLFSSNLYISFLGRNDHFLLNFVFIFFLVLSYFVFVNTIKKSEQWKGVLDTILGVGAIISVLFILKVLLKFNLPLFGSVWNTVDGANGVFGLWMVVIFILSAGLLIGKNISVGRALFYFFVLILSFIPLLVIGFKFLWWVVLISLILLLLLGVSFIKQARVGWLTVLFTLLILVSTFIIFSPPKVLQRQLPLEVSLSSGSSWVVSKGTIFSGAKNFLLGSGLGTFAGDFSKFRTNDFNYDKLAWSLRFFQPFNTYYAVLSEGGILTALLMVFILFIVLGYTFHSWFHKANMMLKKIGHDGHTVNNLDKDKIQHLELFLVVIAWIVLWISMIFSFFGPVLWYLWWILLAMIVTALSLMGHKIVKKRKLALENTPQYNLAFSFSLIVIMAIAVMVGILGVRFYLAETVYAKALRANDLKIAESEVKRSISLRADYDIYHAALARVYLNQAANKAKQKNPDVQSIATLMAQAVDEARSASQLSPNTVTIWENLATMYENAAMLVPQAGEWAVKSLSRAVELEPSNAYLYWRLANSNMLFSKDYSKAAENYKKATELKNDYLGAYLGLARAYELNNEIDKAVIAYKSSLRLGGSRNADVLFNFGRLLYNRNKKEDRKDAEVLWKAAVNLQPKYSNALYSLGLFYEVAGDKSKALYYYYKVKDLNPNNNDINSKISSLLGVYNKPIEVKIPTSTEG